tara:strand:+ start:163 stop:1146 length:984 start_codon:yes stop_codon:yes gene_type:complete
MKILYSIQGTGNGHLSRAHYIYKILKKITKNIDVLIAGNNYSLKPNIPIKYKISGISFVIVNGRIDYLKTISNFDLLKPFLDQKKIPFKSYDLIISDFEPISAWSSLRFSIPSIHISHQASFIEKNVPRPTRKNLMGEYVMKYFCPTNDYIGLHYQNYGDNISEPIVQNIHTLKKNEMREYVSVYLPWFEDDYLISFFKNIKNIKFHIFSKNVDKVIRKGNCLFKPVNNKTFYENLIQCKGVITNAGFQTTSESLHLGKRLLVVPVKNQYEQECNVAALDKIGIHSIKNLELNKIENIQKWLDSKPIKLNFKNNLEYLLKKKINKLL